MVDSIKTIAAEVAVCTDCPLYKGAQHAVPGEGPRKARIFIIGQAPGAQEDATGRPFVGRSGQFLNKLLEGIGVKREDVFITSAVKHFPPKNRPPTIKELKACQKYLIRQLDIVNPQIVVLLGRTAQSILNHPVMADRKVFSTIHPAAALRFEPMRKRIRKDFQVLKRMIANLTEINVRLLV